MTLIQECLIQECRRAVANARRAKRAWWRNLRDDRPHLSAIQLAVCEARQATLERECREAEDELARILEGENEHA